MSGKIFKTSLLACFVIAALSPSALVEAGDETKEAPPITRGANHIGLTVGNLDASTAFFVDVLGWQIAGGDPDYPANFVTDGEVFVTLWQATDPATATPFNRKTNIGLHHLALTVPDLETLDELYNKLKLLPDITIEFAPEFLGDGPTTHMMIREASGLRLEFIVPNGRQRNPSAGN